MLRSVNRKKIDNVLFSVFGLTIILSLFLSIHFEEPAILIISPLLLLLFIVLVDFKQIYFFLFLCLPFSTEIFISDHLATDLPTEPLTIGLMIIYIIILISRSQKIDFAFYKHPISILLFVHLAWITFTVFTSSFVLFSFKFLLAKLWYVITFFFMAGMLLRDEKNIRKIFWLISISLTIATTKVIIHHAMLDFGFKAINTACPPFFRNHVNYAAVLSIFFPFIIYLRLTTATIFKKRLLEVFILILSFGVITAYTRAAYVALFMLPFVYLVIRLKLSKIAIIISSIAALSVVVFLTTKNKFLELVPTKDTVSHTEFSEIVTATSELKDVSTMERYYRWIAGFQMLVEKPIYGFGPGNFYHFYKQYTMERFRTYVSDNPERSGVHNYYLMTSCEQGLVGLIIFLMFTFFTIIYGEKIYHTTVEKKRKLLVMSLILSTVVIDAFLLINDMIEASKIGAFYFLSIACLVVIDLNNKKNIKADEKRLIE